MTNTTQQAALILSLKVISTKNSKDDVIKMLKELTVGYYNLTKE